MWHASSVLQFRGRLPRAAHPGLVYHAPLGLFSGLYAPIERQPFRLVYHARWGFCRPQDCAAASSRLEFSKTQGWSNNPNGVAIFKAQGWPLCGLPWEMRTIHPLPSFPSLLPLSGRREGKEGLSPWPRSGKSAESAKHTSPGQRPG